MDAPTKPVQMEAVPAKNAETAAVEPYHTESMSVDGAMRGGDDEAAEVCCGLCAAFACFECCKCCC